ncbi:hypothetical protein JT06_07645 [Desulfobulbus sp. Tol-SR]|nr:hypothetical protein JT06_07645 [Desulfobulbus sp. Tol-SR]
MPCADITVNRSFPEFPLHATPEPARKSSGGDRILLANGKKVHIFIAIRQITRNSILQMESL